MPCGSVDVTPESQTDKQRHSRPALDCPEGYMAAVLEKKTPADKLGSQVEEQLAQATSRIRAHDLAFGGLVLLALLLIYATLMILLDRYLALPEWVRQVALGGFVFFMGAAA